MNKNQFRILSLDGGGIMGAYSASFLATLEKQFGGQPLGRYFDLIAGTSTGGIIAAALALGETASRVSDFYQHEGRKIFERERTWWEKVSPTRWLADRLLAKAGLDTAWLLRPKYGKEALEAALGRFFQARQMEEATTARLVMPVVDLGRCETPVCKTPHLPGRNSRDRKMLIRDAVRATTAAPTYFSHAEIGTGGNFATAGFGRTIPAWPPGWRQ